jgi:hypothetical protein
MGGCRDGMAVVLRQWDAAVMKLRSFGGKRRLQGCNRGCLKARGGFRDGMTIIWRQGWNGGRLEAVGACSDGMAIIWRQGAASGMD